MHPVRLVLADWLGWSAPSHGHCLREQYFQPKQYFSLTQTNQQYFFTNQPTEQAVVLLYHFDTEVTEKSKQLVSVGVQ